MASISGIFLNFVLCILSYIIQKNKKQILLGSDNGSQFFGNPKYFYLFLLKNKNHFEHIFWITASKKIYSELSEKKLPVLYLYSFKAFIAILRSNYLVTSHFINDVSYYFFLPGRFNKIETWHGTPLKEILHSAKGKKSLTKRIGSYLEYKERKSYQIVPTVSAETKKIFDPHYRNVDILGNPRNDVFFDHGLIFEDYAKKFNLNQYSKIMLYCPTFRDKPSSKIPFTINFLSELNSYMVKNNYLFLIKSHYWDKIDVQNYSNIINVSQNVNDVQDLLIKIDILITDYSSVFFDFMLTDKPVIFYPYDFNEYLKNRNLFYDYFKELPGPFANNEAELFELIKTIEHIFNQKEYREKYEQFKDRFNYYKDGKSCERLYQRLICR